MVLYKFRIIIIIIIIIIINLWIPAQLHSFWICQMEPAFVAHRSFVDIWTDTSAII